MRLVAGLIFVLSCVSCGSGGDGDSNNHGYGWEYDVQGASGLKVRYHPGATQTTVHMLETAYNEVQQCTGLTAPPPFVIFTDSLPDVRGLYYWSPSLIAIETWFIFKHEAVHYLLDHNTGNPDPAHNSELFAKCSMSIEKRASRDPVGDHV